VSLGPLVASGALDEELFRWLSVVPVEVPSLRERKEDIALLVEHFLAALPSPRSTADLPPETIELFERHTWPRNVDELRSLVERLAVYQEVSREVLASLLRETPRASEDVSIRPLLGMTLKEARNVVLERCDRLYLTAQLEAHGGNRTKTAAKIGIERESLQRLLKRYGIRKGED
jgi:DNA-binding NtrC family response regulator